MWGDIVASAVGLLIGWGGRGAYERWMANRWSSGRWARG